MDFFLQPPTLGFQAIEVMRHIAMRRPQPRDHRFRYRVKIAEIRRGIVEE
jgi:hypothetical protein